MKKSQPTSKKGPGRRQKTSEASRARLTGLFSDYKVKERQQQELLSIVSALFCRGCTGVEIKEEVLLRFPNYGKLLTGENLWDLLREAAVQQMFKHTPRDDLDLTRQLLNQHGWLEGHVGVVQTASTEALAERAAVKLLDMIRNVRRQQGSKEVHVGFAGGMTLRTVAKILATLLNEPHRDNPETLVFHAMVASFFDDDFYADPNSFISYFISPECRVDVRLVRLPLPGIIEKARRDEIHNMLGIGHVFDRRKEIQIVVSSGSLWSDEHSTLRTYLEAVSESQRQRQTNPTSKSLPDSLIREFEQQKVIGDLLWQPINSAGPVSIDSEYLVTTLMGLDELPTFIADGGSVLLVMGCSGISGIPKSELLKTILELQPTHTWVTDVVTDTPTVEGMYYPHIRNSKKRKPR